MNAQVETPNLETAVTPPEDAAVPPSLITPSAAEVEPPAPPENAPPAVVEEALVALTAEDISFPEGMEILDDLRDEFLTVVNNAEMTPKERAQALIDLQAKAATTASETASQMFATQQQQWQDEVKSDTTIGGAKFDATIAGISRLVDKYGNDDFTAVMASTGAGNNIHVVRFFDTIAQQLNEPAAVQGQPVGQSVDAASKMFPSMKG